MIDIPGFWEDDYFIKKEKKQLNVKEEKLDYIDVYFYSTGQEIQLKNQ